MKGFLLICSILFLPIVLFGCGKTNANQNVPQETILFVSDTCSLCAQVKQFINGNDIVSKVQFKEIQAFQSIENINLFNEYSTICAIPDKNRGVPLLYDKGKCYLGAEQAINYFKQKANIK